MWAAIGIKVVIITVEISQLLVGISIETIVMRKPTIRSTFVKKRVNKDRIRECIAFIMLKCTTQLPIIGKISIRNVRVLAIFFKKSRLPTAAGTVNGKEVRVLRDIGCTGVVV